MKLLDILSSLMMDDTYKGRGKYHSKVRYLHPGLSLRGFWFRTFTGVSAAAPCSTRPSGVVLEDPAGLEVFLRVMVYLVLVLQILVFF